MSELAVKLQNISKTYTLYDRKTDTIRDKLFFILKGNKRRKLKALNNISFEVKKGEFFGIIGHNGSGKTTLLNIITQSIPCDKGGKVEVNAKYMKLAYGLGFNQQLTARQNIELTGAILGLTKKEIKDKIENIIAFADLEKFIDTPIKYFSSGMKSRLGFATAINSKADLLLLDEIFGGVGDETYKERANEAFEEFISEGKTVIIVSHSMKLIKEKCNKVLVLNEGNAAFLGDTEEGLKIYKTIMKEKTNAYHKKLNKKNIKWPNQD